MVATFQYCWDGHSIQDESAPLFAANSSTPSGTKVFWYRWYVLLLYCALITLQGAVWSHWSSIAISMKLAFDWDNVTLALLPFWGPVTNLLTFHAWTLVLRHRGVRLACILSAAMILAGCLLKSIPFQSDLVFKIMCHVCGILNGFAGPVVNAAGTKLAAEWFPLDERVTAVAFSAMCGTLGPTLCFLIGPLIVPDVNNLTIAFPEFNQTISHIREQVALYNYIDLGVSGVLFLLILAYFPNRPPVPPSASSQVERPTEKGIKDLGLNTWLLTFAYSVPTGISDSYAAVFAINVYQFHIHQTQSDWISFIAATSGMIGGLVAGRIIDCFRRPRMALVSAVLIVICVLSTAWFTLICDRILPSSTFAIYASNIIGSATLTAATPLFYEMACESAFPVGEETATMVITTFEAVFSGLFLAVLFIPQAGTLWMNYMMTGSLLFSLPLIACFKEVYHRREFDLQDASDHLTVLS